VSGLPASADPRRGSQAGHVVTIPRCEPEPGNWQGIFGAIWPVHCCRCLKSCAPMTEVGCTGHQHDWPERLGGVSALHPTRSSTSWRAPQFPRSSLGIKNPCRAWFAGSQFRLFFAALHHGWRQQREEWPLRLRTVPGKAGFHGFGPVVRRVSAVARRPAARGRSGCPGRGPHRRAAGRPGRGRAAVSRPSGRRR
jgi:hypothetical protein